MGCDRLGEPGLARSMRRDKPDQGTASGPMANRKLLDWRDRMKHSGSDAGGCKLGAA